MNEILLIIGGGLFTVISYFLVRTMNTLDKVQTLATETESKLAVLTNDHVNKYLALTEKIEDLKSVIVDLTKEIRYMNQARKN